MHERDKRNKRHYGETPKEPPKPRKSMIMQTPVLVLNASYEPINICAARRAIVLVLKGLAMPEEERTLSACGAVGHACAIGDPAAGVSPYSASDASFVPQEHSSARSQHLPVLRRASIFR